MKTLILTTLLTLLLFIPTASAQVIPEQRYNNNGQTIFRVVNNTNRYANCFYQDQANYFTFSINPYSTSMWYPVFGQYRWGCK
jgi:hypothetical protein